MQRRIIAVLVALSMLSIGLPTVAAHQGGGTDLNELVYNDVWEVLGPGGETDRAEVKDALQTAGLYAEPFGGEQANACTHHADDFANKDPWRIQCNGAENRTGDEEGGAETLTAFNCRGQDPDTSVSEDLTNSPTETDRADIDLSSNMPFHYNDRENRILEATGSFFVDFQFSGEDADEVNQVWFGYLTNFAWPASSSLCQGEVTQPGAYYEFYRGDTTSEDGWEVVINTLLVPDAPYGAVVRALGDTCAPSDLQCVNANTIAAGFTYANVNNYLNDPDFRPGETPQSCDDGGCPFHDTTPPNAIVYTGNEIDAHLDMDENDGNDDKCEGADVAVEYGEPLAADGQIKKSSSSEWGLAFDGASIAQKYTPPPRDVDAFARATTETEVYGPGYCFFGVGGDLDVTAWDQLGNRATKTVSAAG